MSGWARARPALPTAPRPGRPAPLTIVLDDLSEVVGHEVPQGALVGQAQAVREQHRCVYHGAVDDLGDGRRIRDLRPSAPGVFQSSTPASALAGGTAPPPAL